MGTRFVTIAAAAGAALACICLADLAEAKPSKLRVYIGTYTNGDSKGIYRFDLDLARGKATQPVLAAEATNPGFLELHPNGRYLYATGLAGRSEGNSGSFVSALAIEASGNLRPINTQPTQGKGACHVTVDPQGKNLLVAHYSSGDTAVLPIRSDGGLDKVSDTAHHKELGSEVHPTRQEAPHPHSVNVDAAGKHAFVADLGIDKVMVYKFDSARGTLTPGDVPFVRLEPGGGPRHFAFHPSGKFAYANNELTNTVAALTLDGSTGELKPIHAVSTLPRDFSGENTTAETRVHPSGKFLYVSNRGHDSIAIFKIDSSNGRLTAAGHASTRGQTPRNFNVDPTGAYLVAANQASDNVVLFRIDPDSGALQPTGQLLKISTPVCVRFLLL